MTIDYMETDNLNDFDVDFSSLRSRLLEFSKILLRKDVFESLTEADIEEFYDELKLNYDNSLEPFIKDQARLEQETIQLFGSNRFTANLNQTSRAFNSILIILKELQEQKLFAKKIPTNEEYKEKELEKIKDKLDEPDDLILENIKNSLKPPPISFSIVHSLLSKKIIQIGVVKDPKVFEQMHYLYMKELFRRHNTSNFWHDFIDFNRLSRRHHSTLYKIDFIFEYSNKKNIEDRLNSFKKKIQAKYK